MYHYKSVHVEASTTCEICAKVCSSTQHLWTHRRRQHHVYNITPDKLVKKCDMCDKSFKIAEEFNEHLKSSHKCHRNLKCQKCDTNVTNWVSHLSLELHMVEKHKMIMFACDKCDYIIQEANILNRSS